MEYTDFKRESLELIHQVSEIRKLLDDSKMNAELKDLEEMMNHPDFWNDQANAKKVSKKVAQIRQELDHIQKLDNVSEEMETFIDILDEEFMADLFAEAIKKLKLHTQFVEKAEVQCLLNGKYDQNNALFTIHAGAGGTEAQDWAQMLLRMYMRWAEDSGYSFDIIDQLPGDEAGIKSVTVQIGGNLAYGLLKSEIGVHRLVRISPFNAQGKRQTSFASVFVYPDFDDDIEVEIDPKDLKVDTYRASGAGGQHVNTTDSAVRITHLPTNIVVSCQNERSQIQNREKAMAILKSRLYQYYEEQREAEKKSQESSKTEIGWGNQIRSYVFQPYQMVKDHRTNHESGQVDRVMDGDLDPFINAWLKLSVSAKIDDK